MITINATWFGCLMTIVVEIMLIILVSILHSIFGREEEEPEIKEVTLPPELEEEFLEAIKKYEEKKRNGL